MRTLALTAAAALLTLPTSGPTQPEPKCTRSGVKVTSIIKGHKKVTTRVIVRCPAAPPTGIHPPHTPGPWGPAPTGATA